jgi:hypothetical protein
MRRIHLALNNGWAWLVGVFGVGLLPCPDCGIPLAVHVWPVAAVVWLYRRVRRRSLARLDLLLTGDLHESAHSTEGSSLIEHVENSER